MRQVVKREVLTVQEAGEALGVSKSTAYEWARTGVIPTVRLARGRCPPGGASCLPSVPGYTAEVWLAPLQ